MFGVPNLGMQHDSLRDIVKGHANENLIRDLLVDSDTDHSALLERMLVNFCEKFEGKFEVACFYETRLGPTIRVR